MTNPLPSVYLARHGETEWALSGRHTGLSDIPLTERGEQNARNLGAILRNFRPALVFTSPLERARRTCELAGFLAAAVVDPDLVEWNYGDYEGLKTGEIQARRPGWDLFRDGCPGGESAPDVAQRADRVIARLRAAAADSPGEAIVFSSAHFLRVLAARWLGLDATCGRLFVLSTASLSILGYEHTLNEPVIRRWNDIGAWNEAKS